MTVLARLSTALTTLDASISTLRLQGGLLSRPLVRQHDPPIRLSGEQRVISYADSVASHPVVFSVWGKLVRSLCACDIGVYRIERDRRLTRVHETSLEALLREPAPGLGLIDLLQWHFNPLKVEGNGLTAKYRRSETDLPEAIIPLDWRMMSAVGVRGGPVEHWISYLMGEPRRIDPREVIHMAWQSPDGSAIGTSALKALRTTIRRADALTRYQEASMDNAARPSGALVFPAGSNPTDIEIAENRTRVEAMHKGVDNAFKLAALYGGAEWKPMSHSAQEAELVDSMRLTQDEVCIAYDIKRSAIAESEIGGRALAEQLRELERSLQPDAQLFESALQRQLIDLEPEWRDERLTVRLDLSGLRRGTFSEEMKTAGYAYTNGIWSEDESREHVGKAPSGNAGAGKPRVPYAQLKPGTDGRSLPPAEPGDGNQDRDRSGI